MSATLPTEVLSNPSSLFSGVPPVKFGDAGPSTASSSQVATFNNPFSVASGGSKASSTANDPAATGAASATMDTFVFMGFMALLGVIVLRKTL